MEKMKKRFSFVLETITTEEQKRLYTNHPKKYIYSCKGFIRCWIRGVLFFSRTHRSVGSITRLQSKLVYNAHCNRFRLLRYRYYTRIYIINNRLGCFLQQVRRWDIHFIYKYVFILCSPYKHIRLQRFKLYSWPTLEVPWVRALGRVRERVKCT